MPNDHKEASKNVENKKSFDFSIHDNPTSELIEKIEAMRGQIVNNADREAQQGNKTKSELLARIGLILGYVYAVTEALDSIKASKGKHVVYTFNAPDSNLMTGIAIVTIAEPSTIFRFIGTHPDYLKQGIALDLTNKVLEDLERRGVRKLTANVGDVSKVLFSKAAKQNEWSITQLPMIADATPIVMEKLDPK